MKATEIVGYAADASVWCPSCAEASYGDDRECPCEQGCIHPDVEDGEGNPVHPIFAGDEGWENMTCGSCHETLESLL